MKALPVIAVFDVGRTNKKFFLFDRNYHVVYERSVQLAETTDTDGYPSEDLDLLARWVREEFDHAFDHADFDIQALNFSAYGASIVHLDESGKPLMPLYNYLKPYPPELLQEFCNQYGGEQALALATGAPLTGSLNSGLQLYRLKKEQPAVFVSVEQTLHLPQWLSYLFTNECCSEMTSLGCHTALWDFEQYDYHTWVQQEGITAKLPPIFSSSAAIPIQYKGRWLHVGAGLHDSSSALLPYLVKAEEPFVLISTGTWSVTLNPFNVALLTARELSSDMLCYLTYEGRPVKAGRLLLGRKHEELTAALEKDYGMQPGAYKQVGFNPDWIPQQAENFEEAYHQLVFELVEEQAAVVRNVHPEKDPAHLVVEGGFAQNPIFMHLLARTFSKSLVSASVLAQASALGAALALHGAWQSVPTPASLVPLQAIKG